VATITSTAVTTYYSIPWGGSFTIPTGPNKGLVPWSDIKSGATIPIDTLSLTTAQIIYILVPQSGGVSTVLGQNNQQIPFPRDLMSLHEIGHSNCGPGQCAVDIENRIRAEQNPALPQRSGQDHESIPTDTVQPNQVNVNNSNSTPGLLTTEPAQLNTTVPLIKLEPLPPLPKKPE